MVSINKCLCVLSYGRVPRLLEAIDSVQLPTYVFNPTESWWDKDMPDFTREVLDDRPLILVRRRWKDETEVRNAMIEFAHKMGHEMMIMLDADEALEGLDNIDQHGTLSAELIDYDPDGSPLPPRTHRPIVAVDVREGRQIFTDKRVASTGVGQADLKLHHHSYDVPEEYEYKLNKKDGDRWPPSEHRGVLE